MAIKDLVSNTRSRLNIIVFEKFISSRLKICVTIMSKYKS